MGILNILGFIRTYWKHILIAGIVIIIILKWMSLEYTIIDLKSDIQEKDGIIKTLTVDVDNLKKQVKSAEVSLDNKIKNCKLSTTGFKDLLEQCRVDLDIALGQPVKIVYKDVIKYKFKDANCTVPMRKIDLNDNTGVVLESIGVSR